MSVSTRPASFYSACLSRIISTSGLNQAESPVGTTRYFSPPIHQPLSSVCKWFSESPNLTDQNSLKPVHTELAKAKRKPLRSTSWITIDDQISNHDRIKPWPTDLDKIIQTEAETRQTQSSLMEVSISNKLDRRLRLRLGISTTQGA